MALKLPDNPGLCDAMAQIYGALAGDGVICIPVSGKEVIIKDDKHSIMEGFEITNYNFHVSHAKGAVQNANQLPGPKDQEANAQAIDAATFDSRS